MSEAGKTDPTRSPAPLAAGEGRQGLLFLDAFSGIAGDMLVAALVDLGVPTEVITDAVGPLPLPGVRLDFSRRSRSGITAAAFDVHVDGPAEERDYATIRSMLEGADHLTPGARRLSQRAFELLARAEADIHGTEVDRVRFHELGAADSIVDIIGSAAALDHVGARVVCSPLPMGRGMIQSRHGTIPAPAPATVACLRGIPTYDAGIDAELVTPTGACLVASAATEFSRWPSMRPERVGWGAGTRELSDRPNLLRVVLGTPSAVLTDERSRDASHVVLETNVDDMSGEIAAFALEEAFRAGALDVWTTPIGMKKGRPALMISALARAEQADQVSRALLSQTTSLGLRVRPVGRIERPRRTVQVDTPYGVIGVKLADGDGLPVNVAPEYEDCRAAAEAAAVPVKQVYAAAVAAAMSQIEG
jgi:uncharacterized protein (TIGR00299 family) protein